MRHKGVDKEETRKKMIEALGQGFRKNGYGGIGINGLSKSAGVTSGAFYAHFGSKEGAFSAALAAGLDEVIKSLSEIQIEHGAEWVEYFADYYVGEAHRADLENGCAMATLTSEVVRFGHEMHAMYEDKMSTIAMIVANGLYGETEEKRNNRAWSMLGLLIGGINITRGMKSEEISDAVAGAIKLAAIKAAGRTRAIKP